MKRKRKRWVKTKNAEKEEKGKRRMRKRKKKGKRRMRKRTKRKKKRLAREEKNNGLEALLTEKLYLCVQICARWHKNNEKPILNNLEKRNR